MKQLSNQELLKDYKPPEELEVVLQLMSTGESDHQVLAHQAGISVERLESMLQVPQNLIWLSGQLSAIVENLIGLADIAIAKKAWQGDVKAYNAMLDRYGLKVKKTLSASFHSVSHDFSEMSNEDLQARVAQGLKEHKIIDVPTEKEDDEGESPGRSGDESADS